MTCKKRTWLPKICKKVATHASCNQQQYNITTAKNNKDHKCLLQHKLMNPKGIIKN
jgi:hypothetical protein